MRISQVEPILFNAGMPGEHLWCFVRVSTDEGVVGIGESTTTDPTMVAAIVGRLGQAAVGRDPGRIQEFWQHAYTKLHNVRGGNLLLAALGGIEQALWDIKGKVAGLPVYDLLGGAVRERVPLYLNHRFFQDVTPNTDPKAYADRALLALDRGFHAVKIDPYDPLRGYATCSELSGPASIVAAVREAVGPAVEIAVDSHGRFNLVTAIRAARALEEFDVLFLEEPLPPENLAALRKLRESVAIPLATGERVYTKWGFRELLESNVVEIIQPDVTHCGGIFEARLIAAQAESHFVDVAGHNYYGPISLAASLHVAACSPNFVMQELSIPFRASVQQRELVITPLQIVDGVAVLPSAPGLGVSLNDEVLRRFRVSI